MAVTGIMLFVLILSLLVCAYMAWNIGANDVANACEKSANTLLSIVYD